MKKLTRPQEILLAHLAANPNGIACSGQTWRTMLALDARGLADAMYHRRGRLTPAGMALVKSWQDGRE